MKGESSGLEATIGTDVNLSIDEWPVFLNELEGVSWISMLTEVSAYIARVNMEWSRNKIGASAPVRSTTVGEQNHHLVNRLGVLGKVVPEHVCILQVRLGITLLGVDEVRELGGVANKKHWRVVEDLYRGGRGWILRGWVKDQKKTYPI